MTLRYLDTVLTNAAIFAGNTAFMPDGTSRPMTDEEVALFEGKIRAAGQEDASDSPHIVEEAKPCH
jgi:hypothetical protein